MSDKKDTLISGHEYDGIKEYDNPLPMWWLLTFLITIEASFFYMIHYHTETHLLIADEYANELSELNKKTQLKNSSGAPSREVLLAALADPASLSKGRNVFTQRCASCHAPDGGGGIGPNLCDSSWIHGKGDIEVVSKVVREGVPSKGMPAWATMMSPEEVIQVTTYVASLKGTHPAQPKPPQGEKVQ